MEKFCVNCIYEREPAAFEPCLSCFPNDKQNFISKPTTNADKYFRNATDEEIVEAWYYVYYHVIFASTDSRRGLLDWLKQEAQDVEEKRREEGE